MMGCCPKWSMQFFSHGSWFTSSLLCLFFDFFAICAELRGANIPDWASFHHNLDMQSDATVDFSLIPPHLLQAGIAVVVALSNWCFPAITCCSSEKPLAVPLLRVQLHAKFVVKQKVLGALPLVMSQRALILLVFLSLQKCWRSDNLHFSQTLLTRA